VNRAKSRHKKLDSYVFTLRFDCKAKVYVNKNKLIGSFVEDHCPKCVPDFRIAFSLFSVQYKISLGIVAVSSTTDLGRKKGKRREKRGQNGIAMPKRD
jgi:hypothetical protein